MRARVVDWTLLIFVLAGTGTGLISFLVGDQSGYALFVAHGALGLAILGVLAAKLRRVAPRLSARKGWSVSALAGLLTAVAMLLTVGIGIWWVVSQSPVAYPNGMILHTSVAFVLLALCLWHFLLRYRPLAVRDVRDRRSMLRLLGVVVGGGALWVGIEAAQRSVGAPGSQRRFTGSRRAEGALPVTMWMFDNPRPVEASRYTLEVGGAVATPLQLDLIALAQLPQRSIVATLDCTGGWYSEQSWQGIGVEDLLALVGPGAGARYVRFRSVTGYRWSLPFSEAKNALLATQVGGVPLAHGNGAPLRLVAPGRRGFQWVKWVVAVEVLDSPDAGQWAAIFTSGLDES